MATKQSVETACVYVTGSFARGEASQYSDLDLFILGGPGKSGISNLDAICLKADLIRVTRELGLPAFSGDGEWLAVHRVQALVETLGTADDDSTNTFTARLLLLLESRPLLGDSLYRAAIDDVIAKYWRDYEDHAESFMPAFLANDILRLWRTFCVNYEARTRTEPAEQKAKRKLKNYKLKHSRLLTCYSALADLLVEHDASGTVSPAAVKAMVALSPSERIEAIAARVRSCRVQAQQVLERYVRFLEVTNASEDALVELFLDRGKAGGLMRDAGRFGDAVFDLLRDLGNGSRFYRLLVV